MSSEPPGTGSLLDLAILTRDRIFAAFTCSLSADAPCLFWQERRVMMRRRYAMSGGPAAAAAMTGGCATAVRRQDIHTAGWAASQGPCRAPAGAAHADARLQVCALPGDEAAGTGHRGVPSHPHP